MRTTRLVLTITVLVCVAVPTSATITDSTARGIASLNRDSKNLAQVSINELTGTARLVRLPAKSLDVSGSSQHEKAVAFLNRYGSLFGLSSAESELRDAGMWNDRHGWSHLSFTQVRSNVPVFGAMLRLHFDPDGALRVVNGMTIPDRGGLDLAPTISSEHAVSIAYAQLDPAPAKSTSPAVETVGVTLMIYRTGLLRGVPGSDRLVWEVELSDHRGIHEKVYVDAHRAFIVQRIDLVHDLQRVVHDVTYPNPVWREGDPLPYSGSGATADQGINELIEYSEDAYEFFLNLSGGAYESWNGNDAKLHTVYNADFIDCPNAVSQGAVTGFCEGTTADDIVSHEWSHSYTGATHGLIYAWQSGALNEAYSDIFGESIDLINGAGNDEPGAVRASGACSGFTGESDLLFAINTPPDLAGTYDVGGADFNPTTEFAVTADLELVDDGEGNTADGCQEFFEFTPGAIAVMQWGTCFFRQPAVNAESAGASGVIIINTGTDTVTDMPGAGARLGIPSVMVGKTVGESIISALQSGSTINATISSGQLPSYRWLIGEDSTAFGGAIRDMWMPTCMGDPGKVSDLQYWCSEDDGGGVHTNSGVPNAAYALLVDGGVFNGIEVEAIGMTKAAQIYWRAMTVYQVPTTNFADHAEFIELSCTDLIGLPITDPRTGDVSSDTITANDCAQVAEATKATEMRDQPLQCNFTMVLQPDAPSVPLDQLVYSEGFDSPPSNWTMTNEGVSEDWLEYDWRWVANPPAGADGGALYAINLPAVGDACGPAGDQSGVLHLESPEISLPAGGNPMLVFDHYVSTDPDRDGGNIRISVNGGPYTLIPEEAFRFNAYNATLETLINNNPLAGERTFSGSNQGSFGGSWGQSQVSLAGLAKQGDTIQIRFDFGFDDCFSAEGWYLDSVQIFMSDPVRRSGGRVGS